MLDDCGHVDIGFRDTGTYGSVEIFASNNICERLDRGLLRRHG